MDRQLVLNALVKAIKDVSPYAREEMEGWDEHRLENTYLVDLGVSSIDYCQIANIVMDQLDVHCPIDLFVQANNIRDIVTLFCSLNLAHNHNMSEANPQINF